MFYSLRVISEDVKGKYILQESGRLLCKFLLCACAPHMGFQVVFGFCRDLPQVIGLLPKLTI